MYGCTAKHSRQLETYPAPVDRRSGLLVAVIVGAVLVGYAPYLDADFVGTDSLAAIVGARVTSWTDFANVWLEPLNGTTSFAVSQAVFWRPIATLVFSLDYALWGLNPVGYHVTNSLIQALVVGCAWWMLRGFGLSRGASFGGALLVGFHPSMATAVPVLARRYDALSAAALLACLALLCHSLAADGRRARWLTLASALMLGVALLCKESAFAVVVLLPLVILIRRRPGTSWLPALAAYGLVAILTFGVRYLVLGELGGHNGSTFLGGVDVGGYQLMLVRYAQFLVWPLDTLLPTSFRGVIGLAAAGAVAVAVLTWSLPARQRGLFVLGAVWIVWFGVFFTALLHMAGAWYMYYPLGGAALLLGALIDGFVARLRSWPRIEWPRLAPIGLGVVIAASYAVAALPAVPLIHDYRQWHAAGDVSRRMLAATAACMRETRPTDTITFWNLPVDYLDGTRETQFLDVTMLEGFSMESYLLLLRPTERHPMYVGASVRLSQPVPDLEFRCERPGTERVRLVVLAASLPVPDLPPFDVAVDRP